MDEQGRFKNALKRPAPICLVLLWAVLGFGDQDGLGTARLAGEVKDEAGQPLPGVKVGLMHLESNTFREVVTDGKGKWAILGLGTGAWKMTLTLEGYRPKIMETHVSQLGRNVTVQTVLRRARPKEPAFDADIELVERGNRLFEEKNAREALLLYREFLDKHPKRFQVHFNIGNCHKELGEYDQALVEYGLVLDKIRETNPEMIGDAMATKTLAAMGDVALKKGDPASARADFEKALALYPKYANLPHNIGEIYFSYGMFGDAISYYSLATRIKPDWPEPWLKLGFSHLKMNEIENAAKYFGVYLERAPQASNADEIRKLLDSLGKNN